MTNQQRDNALTLAIDRIGKDRFWGFAYRRKWVPGLIPSCVLWGIVDYFEKIDGVNYCRFRNAVS